MSAGTHKPAEALHQQIAEPKSEALRIADALDDYYTYVTLAMMRQAAAELRRQHARIAELEAQLASPHPLHQHLLHMLGAKDHEEAGCIIARLHALELAAAQQAVQAAVPEGWKLAPIKVPGSAFAWVSGGYPAGYKAWDERDTAVVHERAQRAWEAILNGITAPAHPSEGESK